MCLKVELEIRNCSRNVGIFMLETIPDMVEDGYLLGCLCDRIERA